MQEVGRGREGLLTRREVLNLLPTTINQRNTAAVLAMRDTKMQCEDPYDLADVPLNFVR